MNKRSFVSGCIRTLNESVEVECIYKFYFLSHGRPEYTVLDLIWPGITGSLLLVGLKKIDCAAGEVSVLRLLV